MVKNCIDEEEVDELRNESLKSTVLSFFSFSVIKFNKYSVLTFFTHSTINRVRQRYVL